MLTAEQLEQRRSLLTASDAAAVLGLSPWRTPHDVWAEKTGRAEPWKGNWKTRRGEAIEPLLIDWLGEKSAPLVVRPAGATTLVHPVLSWLGATPDALLFEDGADRPVAVGEAKSTGMKDEWLDENENPQVPDYYATQLIVLLAVCRVPRARVAVEILGESEPWIIPYERNEDDELAVLEALERFHRDHILTGEPPSLEDATYRQVARVFSWMKRPHQIGTTPEADALAARYLKAKAVETKAHEAAELAKTELCKIIGDNEGITAPTWRATWKYVPPTPVPAHERTGYRRFDLRKNPTSGATSRGKRR